MRVIGIVLTLIGLASLGISAAAIAEDSERNSVPTDAVITNETTYGEELRYLEVCVYERTEYDEYGAYTVCDQYQDVAYYDCSAYVAFTYVADPGANVSYNGTTSYAIYGAGVSCLESIENAFPSNSTLRVYFWEDDPEDYSMVVQGVDYFGQICTSFCSLIFAILGVAVIILPSLRGETKQTGGLGNRVKPQTQPKQSAPPPSSFQTLPSQQHSVESRNSPASKESSSFWDAQTDAKTSVDQCSFMSCTRTVNQYHFKCTKCQKSFCSLHSGRTIFCQQCESTS